MAKPNGQIFKMAYDDLQPSTYREHTVYHSSSQIPRRESKLQIFVGAGQKQQRDLLDCAAALGEVACFRLSPRSAAVQGM